MPFKAKVPLLIIQKSRIHSTPNSNNNSPAITTIRLYLSLINRISKKINGPHFGLPQPSNKKCSPRLTINAGFPQRNILAPTLHNIYTSLFLIYPS